MKENMLPVGVKDYCQQEMEKKEYIQNTMKNLFRKNGYQLIETPTFEYFDMMQDKSTQLYNLINRQGEILALRSDMTKSIARVVSTIAKDIPYPQRYSYIANSFRYPKEYLGMLHEFTQAGIEMIGKDTISSDVEVISLAIKSFISIGITDFTVHLSSMELFDIMLDSVNITTKEKIYESINKKDIVSLKKQLKNTDYLETVRLLTEAIGDYKLLEEIKAKISDEREIVVLNRLEAIYNELKKEGLEKYILFDFSLLSYGKYYTGIYFQVFTSNIGNAICEGGRYNNLLAKFGNKKPAVGFGVNINDLMKKNILIPKEKKILTKYPNQEGLIHLYDNETFQELSNYGLFYNIDEIQFENKKYVLKEGKYVVCK